MSGVCSNIPLGFATSEKTAFGHTASTRTDENRLNAAQATWKLDEGEALFVHQMESLLAQERCFESITLYL